MPSALLAGHFGPSDAGESATLGAFERALPEWTPVLATSDPAATHAAHGCRVVDARRPAAVVMAAARADAAVLAGWSIGADGAARPGLRTALALVTAAKLRGRPTALLGISARGGRSAWEERLSRRLLGGADLVVLRDELSARHLESAGVPGPFRIGTDPAWGDVQDGRATGTVCNHPRIAGVNADSASRPRRIVVAIEARGCPPGLIGRLGDALAAPAAGGAEIALQPWAASAEGRDHGLVAELAGRIGRPVQVLEPLPDLGAGRTSLAGIGAVVALGSHALIAAAAAGVPAVAIACEPAIADLARRLDQPLVAADASTAEIAAAIGAALEHEPALPNAVEGQIATAEEGFRLLRLLLSEGRSEEVGELSGLPLRRGPGR
ncbi:MAG: polysaccharide pyruvyl transferase family protein [Actinobacteria bacterium]|nr:polysaccharide pyruvyl transferase family protein [Actinomycetota bacterium]